MTCLIADGCISCTLQTCKLELVLKQDQKIGKMGKVNVPSDKDNDDELDTNLNLYVCNFPNEYLFHYNEIKQNPQNVM